jgi:hypothetical protein
MAEVKAYAAVRNGEIMPRTIMPDERQAERAAGAEWEPTNARKGWRRARRQGWRIERVSVWAGFKGNPESEAKWRKCPTS